MAGFFFVFQSCIRQSDCNIIQPVNQLNIFDSGFPEIIYRHPAVMSKQIRHNYGLSQM
jgi:hypothetical protein